MRSRLRAKTIHRGHRSSAWRRVHGQRGRQRRDRLTLTFAPLVKTLAYRNTRGLPAHAQVEELISSGLEALITALDRYDPGKGATLEQYLWTRISGAMVDELRRNDSAPRSLRTTQRDVRGARRDFRAVHHRQPSDEEVSEAVGITLEKLHAHQRDELAVDAVGSLNVLISDPSSARRSVASSSSPPTAIRRRQRSRRSTATRWPRRSTPSAIASAR